tara:strand:- start:49 stop:1227 length:1179 start_codon:yes stop_codon:yes gene_type:complete
MAFEEDDILGGLDLSVLEGIATAPAGADTKKEEGSIPVDVEPGIFQPGLAIKEVDELPLEDEDTEEDDSVAKAAKGDAPEDKEVDAEEEDEDDAEKETPEAEAEGDSKEEDVSVLKVFAEMQRDSGLIDFKEEDFQDDEEWLLGKVQETIDGKVSEYKESMPEEIKYLLDNYEDGVSMYDLINMSANEQSYSNITTDSLADSANMQKMLVKDLLSRSGWSEDRVAKKIARYEDTGVLLEEAEEALDSLKEMQTQDKERMIVQQKNQQKQKAEAHTQWLGELKDHITKTEEIIPGFDLSPKDKDSLYKGITKLDRDGKNEIMRMREKDPEFDLKIAYLATILKWDFSAFERQSTTKATRKLSDAIKSTKKAGSRPSRGTSKSVDFGTMRKSIN